ncbi:hypothetical protein BHU72_13135 [Desulfuribacillus stibiiarsenatis]|uniref:HipA-like kinase domain-containing protein n=1 Tax=Desulfuribacillus stibiiarsenatis TaxID=1390249 RepID=A0A1E5L8Q9_9FIRM|nr:HipA family kinase [Desulfuribacillus stibiiarsenatis]OEH86547.1 hypothetical protein BHU72_13135 [Desulfuribacillus stibiiarsenatis]
MAGKWKFENVVASKESVGTVWYVSHVDPTNKRGYFKFPTAKSKKYSGPLSANEYIAYKLANLAKLPVATVELQTINEQLGTVSIKHSANRLLNWTNLYSQFNSKNIFNHIYKPERLVKMFVFDIWILNIDRNNRNIILYRKALDDRSSSLNATNIFNFYLIDHGLSLLGAIAWKKRAATSTYWNRVAKYNNRYLNGLPTYLLKHKSLLRKYANMLQKIPNDHVSKIIEDTPDTLLTSHEKSLLKKFLINRKSLLPMLVNQWIKDFEK